MRKNNPLILCLVFAAALAVLTLAYQPTALSLLNFQSEPARGFAVSDPQTASGDRAVVPAALEVHPVLAASHSGLALKVFASVSEAATTQTTFEATVRNLINAERTRRGLGKLALSFQLATAARAHSTDMATRNYFSHTGLNGSSMTSRINVTGYKWLNIGETIYAGSGSNNTPEKCVTAWLNSAGHRQILLNPTYTQIGIGYSYNAKSKYGGYFTADFGKPR